MTTILLIKMDDGYYGVEVDPKNEKEVTDAIYTAADMSGYDVDDIEEAYFTEVTEALTVSMKPVIIGRVVISRKSK